MDAENMEKLLLKPVWHLDDVMAYCNCKKSKATKLVALCRDKFGGRIISEPTGVRRDSFLKMMGTTAEAEARNITLILQAKRQAEEFAWRNQA